MRFSVVFVTALLLFACDCGGARLVAPVDAGCERERCDGLDNDCDGEVDEEFPIISCGVGACVRKVSSCADGVPRECEEGPAAVETCDGVDNDCNGWRAVHGAV